MKRLATVLLLTLSLCLPTWAQTVQRSHHSTGTPITIPKPALRIRRATTTPTLKATESTDLFTHAMLLLAQLRNVQMALTALVSTIRGPAPIMDVVSGWITQ